MSALGEIRVGDVIRDNDPRSTVNGAPRDLEVVEVRGYYVHAKVAGYHGKRRSKIDIGRIYLDTKPRKTGFTLVKTVGSP